MCNELCKYCGVESNEALVADNYGNCFHQECEDEFEFLYSEWSSECHAFDDLNWNGDDVNLGEAAC